MVVSIMLQFFTRLDIAITDLIAMTISVCLGLVIKLKLTQSVKQVAN